MSRSEIINNLVEAHRKFIDDIMGMNDDAFIFSLPGKWSAGQQLDHIRRSVKAVKVGLTLPKFIIRIIVGKANRPSRDYESLVAKYHLKLKAGGKAGGRFVPSAITADQKEQLANKLSAAVKQLAKKVDRFQEQELDHYILPHPLLGKLTVREMLYFTIHHVEHHHDQVIEMRN